MCDENHFTLEFIQSQGKEFLMMREEPASKPKDGDNELIHIKGYRQRYLGNTPAPVRQSEKKINEQQVEEVEEEGEGVIEKEAIEEEQEQPVGQSSKKKKTKRNVEMLDSNMSDREGEVEGEGEYEKEEEQVNVKESLEGYKGLKKKKNGKKSMKKLRLHH